MALVKELSVMPNIDNVSFPRYNLPTISFIRGIVLILGVECWAGVQLPLWKYFRGFFIPQTQKRHEEDI